MLDTDALLDRLGISRHRLALLRDGEGFPAPTVVEATRLWDWSAVEGWQEARRGERPDIGSQLELQLRQLERAGFRVWVGEEPQRAGENEGDFPIPGSGWVASISLRGWGAKGSTRVHGSPRGALQEALGRFSDRMDREDGHGDLELKARIDRLAAAGWVESEGDTFLSTLGRQHSFVLTPPSGLDSERIAIRAESVHEAKRRAADLAERAGKAA